jgi:hypothetical protein
LAGKKAVHLVETKVESWVVNLVVKLAEQMVASRAGYLVD